MEGYNYAVLCPVCARRGGEGDLRIVVEGHSIRILCVRCERFDVQLSITRLVSVLSALVEEVSCAKSLRKGKLVTIARRLLQ